MASLRAKGLPFVAIGKRIGCSERTARRYVGDVKPQLALPGQETTVDADPRVLRENLLSDWLEQLNASPQLRGVSARVERLGRDAERYVYGCPPSVLLLGEAERMLRKRLSDTGTNALRIMARQKESQNRFLQEVVGDLVSDYIGLHHFHQAFGEPWINCWRPPSERPPDLEGVPLDPNDS